MRIYIPTHSRYNAVKTKPVPGYENILVVPPTQQRRYIRNNPGFAVMPCKAQANGIRAVRQWLIERAYPDPLCMCDDDVKLFVRDDNRKLHKTDNPSIIFDHLFSAIPTYGAASVGMRLFNNTKPDIVEYGHIHTLWTVDTSLLDVEIPPECEVLEDTFVSLYLAVEKGVPNIVYHKFAQESGSGQQPGGCSLFRTPAIQNTAARYLANRFPDQVKIRKPKPGNFHHNITIYWSKCK
jgi:hypothetical protein